MRDRPRSPRLGLGEFRVDPERARFRTAADVLQYFSDLHEWSHARLAQRCGVRRERITRWLTGPTEPTLSRLAEVLDPLGWTPVIALERTRSAIDELLARPGGPLDHRVRAILDVVHAANEEGLDVVVGGEVAALLQGVPVPTRHLVLHVRSEHLRRFLRLAAKGWLRVAELSGQWAIHDGPLSADVLASAVRPASRVVDYAHERRIAVIDLAVLLDAEPGDPYGVGPDIRVAASKLIGCAD